MPYVPAVRRLILRGRRFQRYKKIIQLLLLIICLILLAYFYYHLPYDSRNNLIPSNFELTSKSFRKSNRTVGLLAPIYIDGVPGNFEFKPVLKSRARRPGDNGRKFILSNSVDHNDVNAKKGEYGMNMVASDLIPMDRIVPDMRHEECPYWQYPEELPSASVVIVFHNEGFTTLLRTVHSVLIRSPQRFLREVLLVDDFSDKENLKAALDDYIMEHFGVFQDEWNPRFHDRQSIKPETLSNKSGKVRVIRNQERSGLIRSRHRGAMEALGDVVVFLDAHCEVNYNWLVPLLAPIKADYRTMTVPIIDGIDSDNFEYRPVYQKDQHFVGIWEWGMLYKETRLDLKEHLKHHRFSEPYESPTHAGGLLAISRKFFAELHGYDLGLLVWGGENFELSFKVWQCGGSLLWVPCSRVGHIYRPFMPYSFGNLANQRKGPLVLTNYRRVIEVWFDEEYKKYFYTREPLASFYDFGDITKQLELKEKLKCKSFDWFIQKHAKSVLKDFPRLPDNVEWGLIQRDEKRHLCLDSTGAHPPAIVLLSSCNKFNHGRQLYRLNAKGQLGLGERCVKANREKLSIQVCNLGTVDGPWSYDSNTKQMKYSEDYSNNVLCLVSQESNLYLTDCDDKDVNQKWVWSKIKP